MHNHHLVLDRRQPQHSLHLKGSSPERRGSPGERCCSPLNTRPSPIEARRRFQNHTNYSQIHGYGPGSFFLNARESACNQQHFPYPHKLNQEGLNYTRRDLLEREPSSTSVLLSDANCAMTTMSNRSMRSMSSSISISSVSASVRKQISRGNSESSQIDVPPVVDPYHMLGISNEASSSEIRSAYLRLALLHHPNRRRAKIDYYEGKADGGEIEKRQKLERQVVLWRFIAITASYETLSHKQHRKNYSRHLSNSDQEQKLLLQRRKKKRALEGFWGGMAHGIQRDLKISDSREQRHLDHEGVKCCGLFVTDDEVEERDDISTKDQRIGNLSCHSSHSNLLHRPNNLLAEQRDGSTSTTQSDSSQEEEEFREETTHLFGGPLSSLYKARQYEPFSDAFDLFRVEIGTGIYHRSPRSEGGDESGTSSEDDNFDTVVRNGLIAQLLKKDHSLQMSGSDGWISQLTSMSYDSISENKEVAKGYPSLPILPKKVLKQLCERPSPDETIKKKSNTSTREVKGTSKVEIVHGCEVRVKTKSRQVGKETIVRTETTTKDPKTGKEKTVVEVKRTIHNSPPVTSKDTASDSRCNCLIQSFRDAIWGQLKLG